MNHQEGFSHDHETRTNGRQNLLSPSIATYGDLEHSAKNDAEIDLVDLRKYTDWFMNHNTDINLRFDFLYTVNEAINLKPDTKFLFQRCTTLSLHYANLHLEAQNTEIGNLRAMNEEISSSNSSAPFTVLKK